MLGLRADAGAERLLAANGGTIVAPDLHIWRLPSGTAQRLIPRLRRQGALRFAEPDRPVARNSHLPGADPLAAPPIGWHLYRIGADRAEPPGPGVPLTIIDSGLDMNHMEFRARPNTTVLNEQQVRAGRRVPRHDRRLDRSGADRQHRRRRRLPAGRAPGVRPLVPLGVADRPGDQPGHRGESRRHQPEPGRRRAVTGDVRGDRQRVRPRLHRRRCRRKRTTARGPADLPGRFPARPDRGLDGCQGSAVGLLQLEPGCRSCRAGRADPLAAPNRSDNPPDRQRDKLLLAAGCGGDGVGVDGAAGDREDAALRPDAALDSGRGAPWFRPTNRVRHPRHPHRPQAGAAADRPDGAERRRRSRQGARDLPRRGPTADRLPAGAVPR